MDSTRRTSRSTLRRVAMMAALAALLAPATAAEAASKKKTVKKPVVTKVAPLDTSIGETLTIYGKNFRRGKARNSVVFQRQGGRAVFVVADVSTTKQIRVKLPAKLADQLVVRNGVPAPTKFRIRVLAQRFGKSFTALSKSPVIGPQKPPAPPEPPKAEATGDCDGDGSNNGVDADDDNDLLADDLEASLKLDGCDHDTDGDGVEDGYEYQAARDLNDNEQAQPNGFLPYPGKRPYPNPLDGSDATTDYDGDSLTLADEFALWNLTVAQGRAQRTLVPLSYSDGEQYSVNARGADGRRRPTLEAANYERHQNFLAWAQQAGYQPVMINDVNANWYDARQPYDIRDFNRSGGVSTQPDVDATDGIVYFNSEATYFDHRADGLLSDEERDEDADGLTNFDETRGCMNPNYWSGLYKSETAYPVKFAGTRHDDPDSDGDGVRDGADDQDFDDLPNVMECDRQLASGRPYDDPGNPPQVANPEPQIGMLQPFNPCMPSVLSRTCNRHPGETSWAPFASQDKLYFVFP